MRSAAKEPGEASTSDVPRTSHRIAGQTFASIAGHPLAPLSAATAPEQRHGMLRPATKSDVRRTERVTSSAPPATLELPEAAGAGMSRPCAMRRVAARTSPCGVGGACPTSGGGSSRRAYAAPSDFRELCSTIQPALTAPRSCVRSIVRTSRITAPITAAAATAAATHVALEKCTRQSWRSPRGFSRVLS